MWDLLETAVGIATTGAIVLWVLNVFFTRSVERALESFGWHNWLAKWIRWLMSRLSEVTTSRLGYFFAGICGGVAAMYWLQVATADSRSKWEPAPQPIFGVERTALVSKSTPPNTSWVEPTAFLRFKVPSASVQIAVFGQAIVDPKRQRPPFLVYKLPHRDFVSGETIRIPVATIFDASAPLSYWGTAETTEEPRTSIVAASENLAEIRLLKDGEIAQRFKVFFATLPAGSGGSERVYLLPEDPEMLSDGGR